MFGAVMAAASLMGVLRKKGNLAAAVAAAAAAAAADIRGWDKHSVGCPPVVQQNTKSPNFLYLLGLDSSLETKKLQRLKL
jgi:hypothetical protein